MTIIVLGDSDRLFKVCYVEVHLVVIVVLIYDLLLLKLEVVIHSIGIILTVISEKGVLLGHSFVMLNIQIQLGVDVSIRNKIFVHIFLIFVFICLPHVHVRVRILDQILVLRHRRVTRVEVTFVKYKAVLHIILVCY